MSTVQGPIGLQVVPALTVPPLVTATTSLTLDLTYSVAFYTGTSSNANWTLPNPAAQNAAGFILVIKNDSPSNSVTINSASGSQIAMGGSDGILANIVLNYGDTLWLRSDGTYWQVDNYFVPG